MITAWIRGIMLEEDIILGTSGTRAYLPPDTGPNDIGNGKKTNSLSQMINRRGINRPSYRSPMTSRHLLCRRRSAHSLPVPMDLRSVGASPSHRAGEKPIMSFVRLGADALMEPLVKFNYRAHGAPAASPIG